MNNSKTDLNRLYDHLKALLSIKDESYTNVPILEVVFTYKIISSDNKNIDTKTTIKKLVKPKAKTFKMRGYNLPDTMNLKLWGRTIRRTEQNILIGKKSSQYQYDISITNDPLSYKVNLLLPSGENFLTFTDKVNSDFNNLGSFTRYIGSNEYYFVNNILELRINPRKISFFREA